jgi:DNA-binding transcriptional MerR regulator
MNTITKTKFQANKETLERNRLEIQGKEDKKGFVLKTIEAAQKDQNQEENIIKNKIKDIQTKKTELEQDIVRLQEETSALASLVENQSKNRKTYQKFLVAEAGIKTKHVNIQEVIKFYL